MKKVEFVQSASGGGFPAPNGSGFEHGEAVVIVPKKDFDRMEKRSKININKKFIAKGVWLEAARIANQFADATDSGCEEGAVRAVAKLLGEEADKGTVPK